MNEQQEKLPTQGELRQAMKDFSIASGNLRDICYSIIKDYMENCSQYFHVSDSVSKNIDLVHVDEDFHCEIMVKMKPFEESISMYNVPTSYLWDLAEVAKEMWEFRNGGEVMDFDGI